MPSPTTFLVCLALLFPASARADGPKDPLRFVPKQAEVVAKIESPRALLEAIEKHELVQEALKISGIRELYDSTNQRRLYQLIAYFEKELGKNKYELLDALTGGGVVVAGKFSSPAGVMVAVQTQDEQLLKRFVKMLHELAEKELARLEVKEPIRKTTYDGIETYRFGPVNAALVDGAVILASEDKILKTALDQHLGKQAKEPLSDVPAFQEGRKSIPAGAHVWTWLNLEAVKQLPNFKTGFEAGSQDPNVMILFGGLIDVIKRSPYVSASISQEKSDWQVRVRMPRGREGMSGISKMVVPQNDAGSLPLLQPPRTLASISYFMDLGQFWEHREKIFNKKQVEELDKAEKQSGKFLGGVKLGTLLQQSGNHHRVVFASPEKSPYKTPPTTKIPSFAVVLDTRDPQFAKSMNFILRGVALIGTFASKSGLKLVEEEHAGCKMVCYYFPEDKSFEGDPNGIRFNFSPCFVPVGDQLVMSSTVELGKDLIDELKRGSKSQSQPATMRTQLYASGAARALRDTEEQVMTQLILTQALPPAAAREEVRKIIALVERLGTLGFEINYGQNDFRFDVKWHAGTK
jgi:hypothetical protein